MTGLEIISGVFSEEVPQKENEKWIDLDGPKSLYMKVIFDQNHRPITNINFYYLQYEDDHLVKQYK